MTNAEHPATMRIGRVAAELKMRRQRLEVYLWAPRVIRTGGCY